MQIINLLQIPVTIESDEGTKTFAPHSEFLLSKSLNFGENKDNTNFYTVVYSDLPEEVDGVIYIVSREAAAYFRSIRKDLVFPAHLQYKSDLSEEAGLHCLGFGQFS